MDNSGNITTLTVRNRQARLRQLSDSQEKLVQMLAGWLSDIHEPMVADLQNLAVAAHDRETQSRYLRLGQDIRGNWRRFAEAVEEQWCSLGHTGVEPDKLQLVEEHELTEQLAIRELATRLTEACSQEAFALERRVAVMLEKEDPLSVDDNPLGPLRICQSLSAASDALACIKETPEIRQLLMRRLEHHLHEALPDIYGALNRLLIERGILPDLKQAIRRKRTAPPRSPEQETKAAAVSGEILDAINRLAAAQGQIAGPAVPGPPALQNQAFLTTLEQVQQIDWASLPAEMPAGTNLVWQVRNSEAASAVGHIEAATIDIVAMLFDAIYDDPELQAGIKALVGRLQIPVLKVALLDKNFFANRDHPARAFLDQISGISVRWGGEAKKDDTFYRKLEELVARIQTEFATDVEIFNIAIDELEGFVALREADVQPKLAAVTETVTRREAEAKAAAARQEAARIKAEAVVQPWLDKPIYPPIRDFYEEHWKRVLEKMALNPATDERTWNAAVNFMEDLAWSISLKSRRERNRLVALLPRLLVMIRRGLDLIEVPVADRQPFLDMLYEMHTANVKAAMGGPLPEPEARYIPAPKNEADSHGELVVTRFLDDNGVEVQEMTLVGSIRVENDEDRIMQARVRALQRGDWVEFDHGGNNPFRASLKWVSPERTLLVFIRQDDGMALSVTPEALVSQLRIGKAAVVVVEQTLFERALSYVTQVLKRPEKAFKDKLLH